MGALLLLVACWLLFHRLDPDGFPRELLSSVVGATVTLLGAAIVAVVAWCERARAFLDKHRVRRFADETWHRSAIEVGQTTYFDFACVNARLDEPIQLEPDAEPTTLREQWPTPQSILDVGKVPCTPIGSGTVVVTKDHRMMLGVRSRTWIAGQPRSAKRHAVHVVAEGLLCEDVDAWGRFDPRVGALRGLGEELQIGNRRDHIGRVIEMVPTGFAFDQQRWQPYLY